MTEYKTLASAALLSYSIACFSGCGYSPRSLDQTPLDTINENKLEQKVDLTPEQEVKENGKFRYPTILYPEHMDKKTKLILQPVRIKFS